MHRFCRSLTGRLVALLLCGRLGPLACLPAELLDPKSGAPAYQVPGLVAVPGGFVNAAGGNLALMREEISIDTPLGTQSIVSVYNSATGSWRWSHQISYDGVTFVDATGAVHDLSKIADGAPLPGTPWDRIDASTLRTRGGLEHHFRPDGSLEHLRWATLDYPRITYASDEIAQCTGPLACTPIFWIVANGAGAPVAISDARTGREVRFDYDASGRLVGVQSPFDVSEGLPGVRYEYAPWSTLVTALVDSDGVRTEYEYRPGRRIGRVTQIGAGDPAHVFRYLGRTHLDRYPTLHANPLGGVTRYAFDAQRRLARVDRRSVSEVTRLEWEGMRPVRTVDPAGVESRFTYDGDRLATRIQASGNVVRYVYEADGLDLDAPSQPAVRRIEDMLGVVEEREFDSSGRPVSITRGGLETTQLGYSGAVVATLEQQGVVAQFSTFGIHGHWLDAAIGSEGVVRRAFDAVGNVSVPAARHFEGGTLSRSHDADRRLAALELAGSDDAGHAGSPALVSIARRSDGQVTEIARPGGADHRIDYDALGRPTTVREWVDGVWQTESIEHDAAGNQTSRERPNGMREEFEYDAFGRMTRHRALRDGTLAGEAEFTWLSGKLTARYDSVRGTTEVYSYDGAGRLASTAFGYGETIARAYDLRGRLVGETYTLPGIGTVAELGWGYDLADRPVRLVDLATGEVLIEDRLEAGLPVESETANGLRRVYEYDAQGRISQMQTFDAAGGWLETSTVDRTAEVGPPRLEIAARTSTPLATSEERYWLPVGSSLAILDQRIGKRLFGWSDGVGPGVAFAWDALSNPADTTAGDLFVYDPEGSRLQLAAFASGESVAYAYDAAGFVTERNGVPLSWTASGQLASYGADTLEWDMAGRLREMTVGGVTREFALFGGRVESSLTTLGALDLGDVSIHLVTGERRYRHPDFRGNVSFVTDDAGTLVSQLRYGPFGVDATWGQTGIGVGFERRPGFGPFVLLGARVLDPAVGRFLSPDPILQIHNQYAYALGNPLWFQDRDGREMEPRQALQVGLLATRVTVAGVVVATVLATGTVSVPVIAAAGIALALTDIVVNAALQIDTALGTPRSPPVTAPSPGPEPPRQPGPAGSDGDPAPQIKVLVIEAAPAPACTPLAPLRWAGAPPWLPAALLLTHLTLLGVWWQRRRRELD